MNGALCSIYMAEVCHEDEHIKVAWGQHMDRNGESNDLERPNVSFQKVS